MTILTIAILTFSCTSKKETSRDSKSNLTEIVPPTGENASLPYLITGDDGKLYFSWVEKRDSGWVDLKYSTLENGIWAPPELIASGNDWFVNWADYPMMAVDEKGNMMAHFLTKSSAGTYSYDVNLMFKKAGENWTGPVVPHNDGTPTEHGFATMIPINDGTFQVAWLDGRNTGGGHDGHGSGGAMTIRTAVVNMNGNLSEEAELDNRVCDCCQTTGVMTTNGALFSYRDRSELEVRDMSFVKNKGGEWSAPRAIANDNWEIKGCPVNGPRADANGETVAISWFTMANSQSKVKIAFSDNSGESFGQPFVVDATNPLGRVDVVLLDESNAMVSWLDTQADSTFIKYRTVNISGKMGDEMILNQTDAARGSGFPQMEKSGNDVYFGWTNLEDGQTSIKLSKLSMQ